MRKKASNSRGVLQIFCEYLKELKNGNRSVQDFLAKISKEFPDLEDIDIEPVKHLVEALELEHYYLEGKDYERIIRYLEINLDNL